MIDKASPAGWVVQVTLPAPITSGGPKWIGPVVLGAPTFRYFNVATLDPIKAVEATRKHSGVDEETKVAPVRPLSAAEVAAIPLKAGEVKPA